MLLSLRESSKSHNNSLPYRPFDLMDSAAYAAFQEKLNEKKFGNPEMAENLIAEDIVVVDERDTRSSSSSFFFF